MAETEQQTAIFEFTGNHLSLDFTNTINDRTGTPRELLRDYADLLEWSEQAHLLTEAEGQQLRKEATHRQDEAQAVLERAIATREAIYALCTDLIADIASNDADLKVFNEALTRAMGQLYLQPEGSGFVWHWRDQGKALDCMLWPVVRSAADLFTSEAREHISMCAAEDCGWLFLDTSKNHSRRWCDMKSCGNRAKARTHYKKKTVPLK